MAGFDMTEADHGRYLEIYGTARQVAGLKRRAGDPREAGREGPRRRRQSAAALPPTGSDAAVRRLAPLRQRRQRRQGAVPRAVRPARGQPTSSRRSSWARPCSAATSSRSRSRRTRRRRTDNTRPAVLYNAMQHAREWLAGETCRRTLLYFIENYGKDTTGRRDRHAARRHARAVVPVRRTTRTATSTRSRPATACGARTWPTTTATASTASSATASTRTATTRTNWGRDNEGSSDDLASETYRGTGPELRAGDQGDDRKLWNMVDFTFLKNDHTAAELLLYPQGFQQYTPTPDNGIFEALAGDDDESAIADKVFNEDDRASGTSPATGSIRTSPPSSTSPTATRSTTRTARTRSSASRPRARRRTSRTSRASSSRTSRRTSRRSSSATGCSRSTSRSPPTTRATRCRTWATP